MLYRSFLSFFLALCFTSAAYATAIVISAENRPNFNTTNLGSDKTLTGVSVTNASTTVTCAACFPTNSVGYGGYTISLNGTEYPVAFVTSTSNLTLGTPWAGTTATIGGVFYKWVWLQIYSNQDYRPGGGGPMITAGAVGSQNWYQKLGIAVTNSGGVNYLRLTQITVQATTNAIPTTAKLFFNLYRSNDGSFISGLACNQYGWAIPNATPTNYNDLCSYNSPLVPPPPNTDTYSQAEIDAMRPDCLQNNGVYYANGGKQQSCLTFGSGLSIAGGTLSSTGGNPPYRVITTTSIITAGDGVIYCDATAGPVTLQAPVASGFNQAIFYFKKIDASANACTFDPNASETIDGATTFALTNQYAEIDFQSINTAWRITGSYNLTSSSTNFRTVTSSTTLLTTDGTVACDPSAGNVVLTLPSAASMTNQRLTIRMTLNATVNNCSIDPSGSQTINGAYLIWWLFQPNRPLTIQSNGSNWLAVAN